MWSRAAKKLPHTTKVSANVVLKRLRGLELGHHALSVMLYVLWLIYESVGVVIVSNFREKNLGRLRQLKLIGMPKDKARFLLSLKYPRIRKGKLDRLVGEVYGKV